MPNYSLRSQSILKPNNPDQSIGEFRNRDHALAKLNQEIGGDGKPCNRQETIRAFAFENDGNNSMCVIQDYLVETLNEKEALYQIFPKGGLSLTFPKTTNAAGSFTVSTL